MAIIESLGLSIPVVQAPMAGGSTPSLAAAVSNAGGLGSIGIGATDAMGAQAMMDELRSQTERAFNVNLFVHEPPIADTGREAAWLNWLAPLFAEFDAEPPKALSPLFKSFAEDADKLAMLLEMAPPVVSFHFGLPSAQTLTALRERNITMLATATSLAEARAIEAAGIDAIVAQGIEAGGHRGIFDPASPDDMLETAALTRMLVQETRLPVIAAGGIMDGAGIAAALDLGAAAAQLGTAFINCPESAANDAYRTALSGHGAYHTKLTSIVSGRPARLIGNRFARLDKGVSPPSFPIAFAAGRALNLAAAARGEHGFAAHWAGQGAPYARTMPAKTLIETLRKELEMCQEKLPSKSDFRHLDSQPD